MLFGQRGLTTDLGQQQNLPGQKCLFCGNVIRENPETGKATCDCLIEGSAKSRLPTSSAKAEDDRNEAIKKLYHAGVRAKREAETQD